MEKTVDRLDAPYIPIEHGTRWQRMMHWLRNPRHVKMLIWGICRYVILLALSYIVLTPFIFMISMSIRSPWDNLDPSVMWIPRNYSTQVFAFTFRAMAFWRSLWETMKIGVFTGVLQVIVTCVVGYGFARFKFPGRGLLFAMVLFTLIVPMPTILSGFYMLMHDFRIFGISTGQKLLDTYLPFWLPALFGLGLRSAIFIYFYRQFFRGQPKELSEAATVDGCGYFGTFVRIMLPSAGAIIITVFLFALVWQWNETLMPSMFNVGKQVTLAVRLSGLNSSLSSSISAGQAEALGSGDNPYTKISMIQAGCLIMIALILLVYIVLQRFFTESIARTGIVG